VIYNIAESMQFCCCLTHSLEDDNGKNKDFTVAACTQVIVLFSDFFYFVCVCVYVCVYGMGVYVCAGTIPYGMLCVCICMCCVFSSMLCGMWAHVPCNHSVQTCHGDSGVKTANPCSLQATTLTPRSLKDTVLKK